MKNVRARKAMREMSNDKTSMIAKKAGEYFSMRDPASKELFRRDVELLATTEDFADAYQDYEEYFPGWTQEDFAELFQDIDPRSANRMSYTTDLKRSLHGESKIMKITESQLRRIIREEIESLSEDELNPRDNSLDRHHFDRSDFQQRTKQLLAQIFELSSKFDEEHEYDELNELLDKVREMVRARKDLAPLIQAAR